jgi:peptidoglycan/LPS O-acetylase OafA/YrhL
MTSKLCKDFQINGVLYSLERALLIWPSCSLFLVPILRIIHSGRFMVVIFFVISGYVLSYRGLQLAREGKTEKLLESLSSSVFRRWLRLHLPVTVSTFIAFLLARGGYWINLTPDWNHSGSSREQRWYP